MPLPRGPSSSVKEQSFAWFSRPHAFLEECAAQYGDCFSLRVHGWGTVVVVSHPDAIREVFSAGPDVLLAGQGNAFMRPFFREGSLLLLDGDRHRRRRKLLLPAFHGPALRRSSRMIAEVAGAVCRTWPLDQPFSVQERMMELGQEIILRVLFGLQQDEDRYHLVKQQLGLLVKAMSTSVSLAAAESSAAAARFARLRGDLDALLLGEIADRRERPDPARGDVMTLLMEARDADGRPLRDDELRDELVTLLAAGHDTTATSLSWTLLVLDQHPEIRARLVAELDALGRSPDPDALARSRYLGAVVSEALRLRPVVSAVSRQVVQPFAVAGHVLPPGTIVAPAVYLAHRRAEAFPDPDRCRPERFLEREPSPFEYLPFGGGARRCIGMGFALQQMKIVLGTVVARLELRAALRGPVRDVRHGVLVGPSEGARMIARRRARPDPPTDQEERACVTQS
jgi:cytochrome P450